ncbi:MAG: hypothetical protein AB7O43_09655 [Hyphomicrobiaceae bacterium]
MKNGKPAEAIVFARGFAAMPTFFAVVPVLLLLVIGVNVATNRLPLPLIGLLLMAGACCIVWVSEAVNHLGDVTVELTDQELRVRRLFGSSSYAWSSIDEVRLVNPGPTLSDTSRAADGRAGIGVFLRTSTKAQRNENAEPDVVLVSGAADKAEQIIKAADRIALFQRRIGSGRGTKRVVAGFGGQRSGFRKRLSDQAA